ncbi:sensor histidine kinase [Streptomyces iconiensis]|uniref:histidine kinase n=1 Tax=Streptomyces iconiensis TaxID=1384038 RepID=A0ABT6ZQR4_9ACTN|nr:histidine kinase [Streptomyces iconiensis]MDJ1131405.1 histidine kinase [Streptomyces iconiensis]
MRKALRNAGLASLHLLTGAGLSLVCYLMIGLMLLAATATAFVIGAGMLPEAVRALRTLASFGRRRTAAWSGVPVPERYLPLDQGTLMERVRTAGTDPGTHRDLRWMGAQLLYGLVLCYLSLIAWPPALLVDAVWCGLLRRPPVALPFLTTLASLEAALSRALLLPSPSARLAERVEQLAATRAGAVAAHGAELRRIERDLHDGTQAHLVALSMRIGLARRAYDTDPDRARGLLDDAQDQAEEALAGLRHVVRGIHPPVLTDRGLAGAVRALAAGSGLEVTVTARGQAEGPEEGPRAPAAVEAAAYFVVAEALTNAAKHSGAARASVELDRSPGLLRVRVRDEGAGGADETRGTGLLGVRRRVAALDGTVHLNSPEGGPTEMEVELPCAW